MGLRNLAFNVSVNGSANPITRMDSATDDLRDSMVGATGEMEDMSGAIDGTNNVRATEEMESATDDLRESVSSTTDNLGKMEKSFGKIGKSFMKKVTAPIVRLGTLSIRTVAKFDDSMSKVQALSKASTDEFKAMRNMAKDLGSTTAHSASAAADVMGVLASSGYKTNQILAVTPQVLDLASAGGLDLANTASILTGTIAQFQLKASDAVTVSDALAKAQASSKANIDALGESLVYAGESANSMGMDIQQTSAFLGLFADDSIEGGMAGTTFTAMFKDLTGKVKDGNVQIGKSKVAVYDASGAMRDMGSIMADVESATNGMTDAQKNAALQNVFTGQSMKGVDAFLAQGSKRYKELEASIYDSDGAAAKMAEEMEDNIGGAFRNMGLAIENLMIDMGDVFKDDVKVITGGIANLARKFGELDDSTKKTIVMALALAAAMGPLLWGGSKVMGIMSGMPDMISSTGEAFGKLTSPMGLTVAAIVGVIAILVNLYNTNEEFRDKINDIWESIKTIVGGAVEWIGNKWSEHGDGIMSITGKIFSAVRSVVETAIGAVSDILGGLFRFLVGLIDFIIGVFTEDWAKAWDGLGNMVGGTIDVIKGFWDGLINLLKKPVTGIINIFRRNKGDEGDTPVGIDGSHYSGLPRVPYDGYVAETHKDEEILTADDPRNQNNNKQTTASLKGQPSRMAANSSQQMVFSPTIHITVSSGTTEKEVSDIEGQVMKVVEKAFDSFFYKVNLQRG